MDRRTARIELKNREPDFLEQARKKVNGCATYVCPSCGNGRGTSGDGIALVPNSKNGRRYKCFVCGLSEDIIGLWKIYKNVVDDKKAFEDLYNYFSLEIDSGFTDSKKQIQNKYKTNMRTRMKANKSSFVQYYKECQMRVSEINYPAQRGLSDDLVKRFMLGYDAKYNRGTGNKVWKALIIPTGSNSFVARNTDPHADKKNRYRKCGASLLYNTQALSKAKKPIFICEGELDTLSIIEAGGEAIGLGSTANYMQLVKLLEVKKNIQPLILALDNDVDGEETSEKLIKEFERLNISFYRLNIYGDKKDANEALLSDTKSFEKAIADVENIKKDAFRTQQKEYLKTSSANYLQEFINGISENVNTPYIPTGFDKLDNILDGGLYEGLYILGAISSLGKTTLALQIADQIASFGKDVLIFSLEMARSELMAKSISRLTMLDTIKNNGSINHAKTTRGITTGSRYNFYSSTEKELINRAVKTYGEYAEKIYIHEGIGNIGVEQIRKTVKNHFLFTGHKPVVFIDYVQILAPIDVRATDKQNIDKSVIELKRLSRDYKIPIVGISSFNRASYSLAVTMEAFKESGSLEYGSDVLIGLQFKSAGIKNFNVNEAKQKNPREIELVILKNRNGTVGKNLSFEYYPLFNFFRET